MASRSAKFCSSCGERLSLKPGRFWRKKSRCVACGPRLGYSGLGLGVILAAALACAFLAGRITAPKQPFQFIGTRVNDTEINSNGSAPNAANAATGEQERMAAALTAANETVCGAPTRSGKPCQRKVKFGGRCWQHRGVEQKQ